MLASTTAAAASCVIASDFLLAQKTGNVSTNQSINQSYYLTWSKQKTAATGTIEYINIGKKQKKLQHAL